MGKCIKTICHLSDNRVYTLKIYEIGDGNVLIVNFFSGYSIIKFLI